MHIISLITQSIKDNTSKLSIITLTASIVVGVIATVLVIKDVITKSKVT